MNSAEEELLKKHPNISFGDTSAFEFERIPTDIPNFDVLIGGGIATKHFTMLAGPSNAGKSYLALQIVKAFQKRDIPCLWIDAEGSLDLEWSKKCGVDVERLGKVRPTTGEEAFNMARTGLSLGYLVVIDSFAGLIPTANLEEDFSYNPIAWQARFLNMGIPKLFYEFEKNGGTLVAINQLRSSMSKYKSDTMPGGEGQVFLAHLILGVRRGGWLTDKNKKRIGYEIEVTVNKTKIGGENQGQTTIPFDMKDGIDYISVDIREAQNVDLIFNKGSWWYHTKKDGTELKVQGVDKLKQFFIDNPDEYVDFQTRLQL